MKNFNKPNTKFSENLAEISINSRREFIKNSAKLSTMAAILGLNAITPNLTFAAENSTNSSKNSSLNLASKSSANSTNSKGANMQNPQVWFITGASGGLGFELAKYALAKGDKVAATSRKIENLSAKFGRESANFLPLKLTFEKNLQKQIAQNIAAINAKFGRIDNVVNNAGYGLLGFIEEVSEAQLRTQFEVNVFAPFILAQEALKIMRPQAISEGGGEKIVARFFNLSSIAGFRTGAFSAPYSMTKFAISAFSEGLGGDLEPFGIAVINVMPTGFRTQFLGTSMVLGEKKIPDYAQKRAEYIASWGKYSGNQPGDPVKFGRVIYEISRMQKPPKYLFMGDSAFVAAEAKIKAVQKDMQETRAYAGAAVDFADAK